MRHIRLALAFVLAAAVMPIAGSAQAKKPIDAAGNYAVTTASDTGQAMTGTLTIAANAEGNYGGQFTSPALPNPVPIASVAVNGGELLVVLKVSATEFALVWVERDADGTFKGSWHKLGPGINATMTKK